MMKITKKSEFKHDSDMRSNLEIVAMVTLMVGVLGVATTII
ncbi:MAG: hypothetical protein R8K22_02605 [Mariprofundaceae bacterium]